MKVYFVETTGYNQIVFTDGAIASVFEPHNLDVNDAQRPDESREARNARVAAEVAAYVNNNALDLSQLRAEFPDNAYTHEQAMEGSENATLCCEIPTMISLAEYAQRHNLALTTVNRRAARGAYQTAKKIGRNWAISEDEPHIDHRADGRSKRWSE